MIGFVLKNGSNRTKQLLFMSLLRFWFWMTSVIIDSHIFQ